MSFKPSCHLEKYGWKKGAGIGKGEDGIKEAIKVKLKFDNAGMGHNLGEQFTYHWWEKAYNDASQTLNVKEDQNGIQLQKLGDYTVSTKKVKKCLHGKHLLYGTFVKAATLADGTEQQEKESSSESDSETGDLQTFASVVNDEDLFRICGGRTAHKGARHGLQANGKLARIALQDASQGDTTKSRINGHAAVKNIDTETDYEKIELPKKRKKKSKQKDQIKKSGDKQAPEDSLLNTEYVVQKECTENTSKVEGSTEFNTERDEKTSNTNKKKSKKKRKRCREVEEIDNGQKITKKESDMLDTCKKSKKKKKHKRT